MLTERTEHLHILANLLNDKVKNIVILKGGMSKKQKDNVDEQLRNIGKNKERIIVATGQYIGEGFEIIISRKFVLASFVPFIGHLLCHYNS